MDTIKQNRSRPYLVQTPPNKEPRWTPPHGELIQQTPPDNQTPRLSTQVWLPAKIMAAGFVLVLIAMMIEPSLKTNLKAIIALFTFAGALNLSIVLPLGLMIIKGTFARTGVLFKS